MSAQSAPESQSLLEPPKDGVTGLAYTSRQGTPLLASTSWDGTVRLHDTAKKTPVLTQTMDAGPLLSLALDPSNSDTLFAGGLDGTVRALDIETSSARRLGKHANHDSKAAACSCLVSMGEGNSNLLVSASWGKEVCLWDARQSAGPVSSQNLSGKAFDIDVDANHSRIVIAAAGRNNCFLDMRAGKLDTVLERDSSLKFQSRCVRFFPDGNTIASGSVEGRVGVESLEELGLPIVVKKYAFKCHRVNDMVYPVNCIEFHPKFHGTFATGGCDGTVVLWDGFKKKRLTALPPFPTSIAAIAFSKDGSEIAVASSYTFEDGDREHPKDEIFVRPLLESECLPKPKS